MVRGVVAAGAAPALISFVGFLVFEDPRLFVERLVNPVVQREPCRSCGSHVRFLLLRRAGTEADDGVQFAPPPA